MSNPQMISQVFQTLLNAATEVGLAAAALFLAWAGFLYMTAGGSPRRMESAKDAAFAAIGGLAGCRLPPPPAPLGQKPPPPPTPHETQQEASPTHTAPPPPPPGHRPPPTRPCHR